jgi:hypothetical protein
MFVDFTMFFTGITTQKGEKRHEIEFLVGTPLWDKLIEVFTVEPPSPIPIPQP